jgi:hypothetical protein
MRMTRSMMVVSAAFFVFQAAPAQAEAGLPFSFCTQASCACGTTACSCGQVCNLNSGSCMSGQAGFCSSDAQCAASCNSFICEGNVCVVGTRPDAGTTPTPPPGGCSAAGQGSAVLALLFGLRRRATASFRS